MTESYKAKLEAGLEYQDFVMDALRRDFGIYVGTYSSRKYQNEKGESASGIEIKLDQKFAETRNLYIEVAEKSSESVDRYTPSGIMRDDNSWLYLIGNYEEAFLFCKRQLVQVVNGPEIYMARNGIRKKESPTSIGYLLPETYFRSNCILLRQFKFKGGRP